MPSATRTAPYTGRTRCPLTSPQMSGQPPIVLELKPAGSNISTLSPAVYDRIFHTSDTTPGPVSFSGRLIGADGLPLANVTMVAQDYFLNEPASVRTDANGNFAFSSVSLSTDIVRFEVTVQDNGTESSSFSQFYPVQNITTLECADPRLP